MNRLCVAILALVLGLVFIAIPARAQVKMGFVSSEAVISQLSEMKEVERQLLALQQGFTDTLRRLQNDFQTRLTVYRQQQVSLAPDARVREEDELRALEQQVMMYREERLGQNGLLGQEQARLITPLRVRVSDAIKKVANDDKLTVVFEKSMTAFYDSKLDITLKVIDYLKRGN